MNRSSAVLLSVALLSVSSTLMASPAQAADAVSYTIASDSINRLDGIEYVDQAGRHVLQGVTLPWRLDVTLPDAQGAAGPGAQLRADWRPIARPGQWVMVAIHSNGKLLCQSTLDIGNATCYGNTPHVS